ncbi:hypothetical protein EI546_10250 [Aequorivita sp. H23M31]|uniref:Leucine-rich repeat domain-containing protein n=1 Tax=Aequorivita ciconiae TaxID=2494375 RepID=A0A410G477_9FLAO|nr:hypothetical protein [Aequorivita sp. H23M31]QAA82077.1 hypothetical protein EI546_10250 [Aequorivita sp. H23M31]
MKSSLFLLFLIFFLSAESQIVNIPDANFKNALVNENVVDIDGNGSGDADADLNNDGEIQISEALAVLRLIVENRNIASLVGIEEFLNLQKLRCEKNQIQSLEITNLTQLEQLTCEDNQLSALDITQNSNLAWLKCRTIK